MRIISFSKLKEFFSKDANARVGLQDWYKRAKKYEWNEFFDVKKTFNSADNVGNDRYVFYIKGNHYRVVAIIIFKLKTLFIRWVGHHKDYDKLKDINKL